MQNNEKSFLCPFRKETTSASWKSIEDFLPCLKEKCALWVSTPSGGCCGLKMR